MFGKAAEGAAAPAVQRAYPPADPQAAAPVELSPAPKAGEAAQAYLSGERGCTSERAERAEIAEPRHLAANISALAAGQLVTWSMTLVWTLVVPRILGPTGMGELVTAWSSAAILSVLAGLGTRTYLVREMVADHSQTSGLVRTGLALRLLSAPVFVAAVGLYATLAGFGSEQRLIIYLAAGATLLVLLTDPLQALFQAMMQMRFLAFSDVVSRSTQGLLGVLLAIAGWGAVGLTAGWLGVMVVVMLLNLWWAGRRVHLSLRTDLGQLAAMVRGSIAYWAFGVFAMIYLWIDSVMLAVMTPAHVVGWYGVSTKVFTTLLFVPVLLSTVWLPRLVMAFSDGERRLRATSRGPLELVMVLSIPICLVAAVSAHRVIPLLYGSAYDRAIPVMVILAFCIPPMYVGMMLNQLLIAAKRQMIWTWVMAGATVVNPVLNIILIPLFQHHHDNGAIGAALSLLGTELLIAAAGIVIVGRHILTSSSLWRLGRAVVASAAMLGVGRVVEPTGVVTVIVASISTFVVLAWLLRLASPDDLEILMAMLERLRRLATRHWPWAGKAGVETTAPPTGIGPKR